MRKGINPHLSLRTDYDPPKRERVCDHPECNQPGEYKAPRHHLAQELANQDYYFFCLNHVREYNESWNCYAGLSGEEIEELIRNDITWNRPSWPFGQSNSNGANNGAAFMNHSAFLYRTNWHAFQEQLDNLMYGNEAAPTKVHLTEEEKAFAIFGLVPPVKLTDLKKRYKGLVKQYHPDVNAGDKSKEDFFKKINQAYQILKHLCAS